ncbi:MAG TPA: PASTA domain-containing protein, partial [Edaphobacter sp.]|nr:PASTA domain-containing protein [Edaphobacter sp.]
KELMEATKEVAEESPIENGADLNQMFADINDLPADDPLRAAQNSAAPATQEIDDRASTVARKGSEKAESSSLLGVPSKMLTALHPGSSSDAAPQNVAATQQIAPSVQVRHDGGVVVDATRRVAVPSFEGTSLRSVVEKADSLGLRVQPVGSGLAKDQAPAPGTMVPVGTEVVVRFAR